MNGSEIPSGVYWHPGKLDFLSFETGETMGNSFACVWRLRWVEFPRCSCHFCGGRRGGVPGNENLLNGLAVCDYCSCDISGIETSSYNSALEEAADALENLAAKASRASGEGSLSRREHYQSRYEALMDAAVIVRGKRILTGKILCTSYHSLFLNGACQNCGHPAASHRVMPE